MPDHHHGVALLDQRVEEFQQLADVLEMEAGGGFVEDVERVAGRAAAGFPSASRLDCAAPYRVPSPLCAKLIQCFQQRLLAGGSPIARIAWDVGFAEGFASCGKVGREITVCDDTSRPVAGSAPFRVW